jgi:hypothetical protein
MTSDSATDAFRISKKAVRNTARAFGALVVLAAIVVAVILIIGSVSGGNSLPSTVDTKTYQAVFLSNGQVFFGKLSAGSSDYYELRHVYVLLSSVTSKGQPGAQTLVKLTREIHNPTDFMLINQRQVLYIENLDPAGKAAKLLRASG